VASARVGRRNLITTLPRLLEQPERDPSELGEGNDSHCGAEGLGD
jgi:hypothetical protein